MTQLEQALQKVLGNLSVIETTDGERFVTIQGETFDDLVDAINNYVVVDTTRCLRCRTYHYINYHDGASGGITDLPDGIVGGVRVERFKC